MNDQNIVVPDLLRRFVPTPLVSTFCTRDVRMRLETNDPLIITAMQSATVPGSLENGDLSFWKLIRDDEAPHGSRKVTILSSGPLSSLLVDAGTVIVIDRELREVLGFLGPDVSAREFLVILYPIIVKLLRDPLPNARKQHIQ